MKKHPGIRLGLWATACAVPFFRGKTECCNLVSPAHPFADEFLNDFCIAITHVLGIILCVRKEVNMLVAAETTISLRDIRLEMLQ